MEKGNERIMNLAKKKNVIWFFVDQMRAQAMSHRGDPNITTPNLDRLSTDGISFNRAISGTPLCSPFRGSLLTSKYPHQSTVPGLNDSMSIDMRTIAHTFNEQDYRTCWIGKWHLDGNRPGVDLSRPENKPPVRQIPEERRGGFQDWWGYENNNSPFNCVVHTGSNDNMESFRLPKYETDSLTDILIDYVTKRATESKDEPFFAVLSVQPPHNPYIAPEESTAKFNPAQMKLRPNVPNVPRIVEETQRSLAGYYAAIDRIDWNLGRVMQTLRDLGIDQDTYIMFFSDHGDMVGSQGHFRKTVPWEESIRIPFIVGGGGLQAYNEPPADVDHLINHVDIAPTTLGLCGIEKPSGMDGFDYSPFIKGTAVQGDVPDSAYIGLPVPSGKDYCVDRPYRGIVTSEGWKYVAFEGDAWMMHNLNEDPYEQVNLAYHILFTEKKKELHGRLKQWVEKTGDTFSLPEI